MIKRISQLSILEAPFRLLFFLTALSGFLLPAIWISFYTGKTPYPNAVFSAINWHTFEMLFGFTSVLLAGFLLTASANWSGKKQISGMPVLILSLIWIAERLAGLVPGTHIIILAISSICFSILFLGLLWHNLKTNKKNAYIFLPLILLFSLAKILFLSGIQFESINLLQFSKQVAIDVLRIIIVVITGRIIPFFMKSRLKNVEITIPAAIEKLAIFSLLGAILVSYFDFGQNIKIFLWMICTSIHLLRFFYFKPWRTLKEPMLWILHIAYLLLILHFLQEALIHWEPRIHTTILHTFTAGVLGTISIGMITRVSLGHTGRKIEADYWIISMFLCILIGTFLRIIIPAFFPEIYMKSLHYSSGFWTLAFGLFLLKFTTILFTKRPEPI